MKKIVFAYSLISIFCINSFAALRYISLDELVTDSDLIVIGTLQSVSEYSYTPENKGEGLILVEEVISGNIQTHKGFPLKSGEKLKLVWNENFACVYGIHKRTENQKGVWFFKLKSDGTVISGHPARFKSVDELPEIQQALRKANLPIGEVKIVDTSGKIYSPLSALFLAIFSISLYFILYRSRFKIR